MHRKQTFLIASFLLSLFSCQFLKTGKTSRQIPVNSSKADSTEVSPAYAIVPDSTKKGFSLTKEDLNTTEQQLNAAVSEYNTETRKYLKKSKFLPSSFKIENQLINLKDYKRQYVAYKNKEGQREVWVNCFCDSAGYNWKTEIVQVFDGGNCFFNLRINLDTKSHSKVVTNGSG